MGRGAILSTGQAARYAGVHLRTVIRWIERGELAAYQLPGGGHYRIQTAALTDFLKRNGMPLPAGLEQGPPRVLVVDDEAPVRRMIARILGAQGYRIELAESGFEAGLLLGEFRPDLIILDLAMSGLDGFAVLALLRERDLLDKIKVLVVTGLAEAEVRRALKAGAHQALTKPFKAPELLAAAATLVGQGA